MLSTDSVPSVRVHARISLPAPSDPTYGYAPTLASVDWTPSPSAAAAALSAGDDDDALFFGDDTVIDNPYGFLDDEGEFPEDYGDEEDDEDALAQTLVLRRAKAASLPGFRPPSAIDTTPAPVAAALVVAQPPPPWWTKPRYHWALGGCAFVLSGALWAAFAWFLSRS